MHLFDQMDQGEYILDISRRSTKLKHFRIITMFNENPANSFLPKYAELSLLSGSCLAIYAELHQLRQLR